MSRYKVKWKVELEEVFEAENTEEAEIKLCDIDCQHEGEYVSGSFEILSVQKI